MMIWCMLHDEGMPSDWWLFKPVKMSMEGNIADGTSHPLTCNYERLKSFTGKQIKRLTINFNVHSRVHNLKLTNGSICWLTCHSVTSSSKHSVNNIKMERRNSPLKPGFVKASRKRGETIWEMLARLTEFIDVCVNIMENKRREEENEKFLFCQYTSCYVSQLTSRWSLSFSLFIVSFCVAQSRARRKTRKKTRASQLLTTVRDVNSLIK